MLLAVTLVLSFLICGSACPSTVSNHRTEDNSSRSEFDLSTNVTATPSTSQPNQSNVDQASGQRGQSTDRGYSRTTARQPSTAVFEKESLQQLARFLNESLACNFDDLNFCNLMNNGGWNFQQSLLELIAQLRSASDLSRRSMGQPRDSALPEAVRGYFACTERRKSQTRIELPNQKQEPARLGAFAFPSNHRRRRRSVTPGAHGKVLFIGAADKTRSSWESAQPATPSITQLLCLRFDVRLSDDPASELTVKFRSQSQTIKALPGATRGDIATEPQFSTPDPPTGSLSNISFFFGKFASLLFGTSTKKLSAPPKMQPQGPPVNKWLSFSLPLKPVSNPIDSPLYLSFEGEAGVCIDRIHFSTDDCQSRELNWNINATRVFYDSLGEIREASDFKSPPTGTYTFSDFGIREVDSLAHRLTGAFLFTLLLGGLAALLVCVVAISVVCGKRASLSRQARRKSEAVRKAMSAVAILDRTVLRSHSISSLPTDTLIHPIPLNSEENEGADQFDWFSADMAFNSSKGTLAGQGKRRSGRRGLVKGSSCINLKTPGSPPANHRLSLLLSINEDNELVLVSPSIKEPDSVPLPLNLPSSISASVSNNGDESSRTAITQMTAITTSSSSRERTVAAHRLSHLSNAEAESTLAEMAASVAYLGSVSLDTTSSGSNPSLTNDEILPMYEEALHLLNHPNGSK